MGLRSRKSVTGHWQHEVERKRELAVRSNPCPDCDAEVDEKCRTFFFDIPGSQFSQWSHVGRYREAAQEGLVPPLPAEQTEEQV